MKQSSLLGWMEIVLSHILSSVRSEMGPYQSSSHASTCSMCLPAAAISKTDTCSECEQKQATFLLRVSHFPPRLPINGLILFPYFCIYASWPKRFSSRTFCSMHNSIFVHTLVYVISRLDLIFLWRHTNKIKSIWKRKREESRNTHVALQGVCFN